jgi:AraC-like DNA-binding protein
VNTLRLEKAKRLLEEGAMTIDEIAAAVGYSNTSNFARMFKKLEGVTPGQYRGNR